MMDGFLAGAYGVPVPDDLQALRARNEELAAWKREVSGLVGESARAEEDWGKTLDRLCRMVTRKDGAP